MKYKGCESHHAVIHVMVIIVIIDAQNEYGTHKAQLQNLIRTNNIIICPRYKCCDIDP